MGSLLPLVMLSEDTFCAISVIGYGHAAAHVALSMFFGACFISLLCRFQQALTAVAALTCHTTFGNQKFLHSNYGTIKSAADFTVPLGAAAGSTATSLGTSYFAGRIKAAKHVSENASYLYVQYTHVVGARSHTPLYPMTRTLHDIAWRHTSRALLNCACSYISQCYSLNKTF